MYSNETVYLETVYNCIRYIAPKISFMIVNDGLERI